MPKRGGSHLFLPRLKEGEDPNGLGRHIRVSYEALEGLFHLPLKEAAREIGLCPTTFKKACRRFGMEKWPSRKGQRDIATARRHAQTDGVVAANRAQHLEAGCPPAAPAPHTTEQHPDQRAMMVACTSPVWQGGQRELRQTSSSGFPFSSIDASSSNVGASSEFHRTCPDSVRGPLSAIFSPQGLLQQASAAFDARSCGETRYAGPAFQHKTLPPLDAPSYIDTLTSRVFLGVPMPLGAAPEAGPPVSYERGTPGAGPSRERPLENDQDLPLAFSSCPPGLPLSLHLDKGGGTTTFPTPSVSCVGVKPRAQLEALGSMSLQCEPASEPRRERSCVEAVMEFLDLGCPISEADVESMMSSDD